MLNQYIEIKNEYTIQLTNILTPLIFEGFQSIYKDISKISKSNDILKMFQSCLQRIPKWDDKILNLEINRILNNSNSNLWLNDLIKATVKANIVLLTYNNNYQNNILKIDPKFYNFITLNDFIHKLYIECAREFWNNPYLFFHEYNPIEIKKNQREVNNIIKECIKDTIRKFLPIKYILDIYLDDTNINPNKVDEIIKFSNNNNIEEKLPKNNIECDNNITSIDDKTIGSKILNIINNNSVTSEIDKISSKKNSKNSKK